MKTLPATAFRSMSASGILGSIEVALRVFDDKAKTLNEKERLELASFLALIISESAKLIENIIFG
jgi:hypothetical protein